MFGKLWRIEPLLDEDGYEYAFFEESKPTRVWNRVYNVAVPCLFAMTVVLMLIPDRWLAPLFR
jgi:hypothetical protein